MDSSIFLGGSVVAAFAAGVIALMAPCCISVMLPAYFASSFQNRRVLVAMTFVFAAGIATVILPLALGASVLRNLINAQHTTVYVVGGILMLGLGLFTLAGGQLKLPMPGRSAQRRGGVVGVYSLGLFSGIASSCCAPVLAGVLALSGVASSFLWALGLGTAYVFGMVAPLFVISLLWDRYDWRSSVVFRPRTFTFRLGSRTRAVSGTGLASGTLLTVMGVAVIWIGVSTDSMPGGTGWQARVAVELQSWGRQFTDALAWLPSWAAVVLLAALVFVLGRYAARQVGWRRDEPSEESDGQDDRNIAEENHDAHDVTQSQTR